MQKIFPGIKLLPAVVLLNSILFFGFSTKLSAQVSFSVIASVNNNENTGTFSSQGFASSTGVFFESYSFNGKKVHSEATFTYADGTIMVKTHSDVTFTGPSTATGTGTWRIAKGTGSYTDIKGGGALSYSLTGIGSAGETISQEFAGTLQ